MAALEAKNAVMASCLAQYGWKRYATVRMTTLSSITQNHLSLECECGHASLLPVSQLLETLPPDTTVHQVADRARCSRCKRKGFIEVRIVYVGASHVALEATRFG